MLLTAPAGYGKTILLRQWSEEDGRPFAWVTFDRADRDSQALADSVASALASIGMQPGLRRSFVIVFDDAHVVPPELLGDAVLGVLGWLPEGSQLAIASRHEPTLALGRMRAERMLVELRSDDLSMSAAEAASLLRRAGLASGFTAVQDLVRRTEGWPVALQLAAIACAERPELRHDFAQLSGDDHLLADYFRAELLAPLPPSARRFLTRSSVLESLSGTICDEVLDRKHSAAILADLARMNLPLQPVDASHEWYRLHGLVREMLQTELRRADPAARRVLHRRAADWHRRADDMDRAIDHARSAEDLRCAGELMWSDLPRYLGEGRNDTVQRWLSGLTPEQLTECLTLQLVGAHSHLAMGNLDVAEQWARVAVVSLSGMAEESTSRERAGVMIIDAWAARSGARRMGEDAARAYESLSGDSPWRASCCFLQGTAALLTGDCAVAGRKLEEGAARGAVLARDAGAMCLAQLAVLAGELGDSEGASDFARRAGSLRDIEGRSEYPASALVGAVCAAAAMREGRVDEAKAAVTKCLAQIGLLDESLYWLIAEIRIVLARVSLALGDVAGARELLAHASRQARRMRDAVIFQRWFDDAWQQFDARAETALAGAASLTTAELRVLRFLPTHYSFHEIAQRLNVSSNTVKTHVHAVYRKLDASSRSEAVARATDAGLLG